MSKNSEYVWLNEPSLQFMKQDYLESGHSVDDRVTVIGDTAETILKKSGLSKKFKEYMKKGWYSLSTPVWTNFGTDRGLPASCYGTSLIDDCDSIVDAQSEVSIMSKHGGGTSVYLNRLRERGALIKNGRNGKTGGPVHFAQAFDTNINIFSQGSARRGSCAIWLDIGHPDVMEFLAIKSPGNPIQHLSFGVCVSDKWIEEMKAGHSGKRKVWAKVLESRNSKGYPYIFFTDNVNNNTVDVYRDKGLKIDHSNLCSETCIIDNDLWSFVCFLSSQNILKYDEWKDTDATEVLVYVLDATVTEFINRARDFKHMQRAVKFAEEQRALGIGWLGWHSYLQSRNIAWESMEAKHLNVEIAKNIHKACYAASAKMAAEYGEPSLLKGYGRRHVTLQAIAPTKSSSFILGQVSEGIEPIRANYYIKDLAKGKFTIKNKYLEEILESKDLNNDETWMSIMKNSGSVQHLKELSEHEKNVFKTFAEISPMEIIIQAAQRQKYIDQSQSLNLIIDPKTPVKDVNKLILSAWEMGIKTLYYQISVNAAQQLARGILNCTSCES